MSARTIGSSKAQGHASKLGKADNSSSEFQDSEADDRGDSDDGGKEDDGVSSESEGDVNTKDKVEFRSRDEEENKFEFDILSNDKLSPVEYLVQNEHRS